MYATNKGATESLIAIRVLYLLLPRKPIVCMVCVSTSVTKSFLNAGAHGSSYPPYATKLRYDEGRVD